MNKWVYTFDDPEASSLGKDILGNKGVGLVRMYQKGLPVPPGFVITTDACIAFLADGLINQISFALEWVEKNSQRQFGNSKKALLVSVRSGAPVSLPGMMSTIKNVGLTQAVIKELGSKEFVADILITITREFVEIFNDKEQGPESSIVGFNKAGLEERINYLFTLIPENPKKQLEMAIKAVFRSWKSPGVQKVRAINGIPQGMGTACIVQKMVFGNRDKNSGSGVVHTRDPQTGENILNGDFTISAQGDAVVSGQRIIRPENWNALSTFPGMIMKLENACQWLEKEYYWAQDVEFTIESNQLWILQTRNANLSPKATVRVAIDMLQKGLIPTKRDALRYAMPVISELSIKRFISTINGNIIAKGVDAVAGATSGSIVISFMHSGRSKQKIAQEVEKACIELKKAGKSIVLVTDEMDPELLPALEYVNGILSHGGGKNCHLAIIARKMRIPTIIGCDIMEVSESSIIINKIILKPGDELSIDGSSGDVYAGLIPTVVTEENIDGLDEVNRWIDELDYRLPWALGTYPELSQEDIKAIQEAMPQNIEDIPWQTEKARVIELLARTFPKGSRLGMTVIDSHDKDGLLIQLYRSVDEGFEPGVRSCYVKNPPFGKAPWEMGLNRELAEKFVAGNPDYIKDRRCKIDGAWGTYPDWISSSEYITELIVMDNPPGLGLKDSSSREQHFVFNVQCNEAKKEIVVELLINTDQLRDIEKLEQSEAIYISMQLDQGKPFYKHPLRYSFGYYHIVGNNKQCPPLEFWEYEAAKYSTFLGNKSWNIAESVASKVFNQWWIPPFALPYRMMFLSHHDLDVLEVQGRCDKDGNVEYALIYDCKGRDETRQAREIV
jgi:phosphohistidine swiveling domain-containing protein